eukprot:TRINITY_DN67098_c0_g1_i1.p1 TRINITY_DN67098_c0_g1~~TRINITY_DN67098_c0_g1_i1.p1  ORF type:complete len:663 (+),score=111.05 TRINITY_DN67098_c0_g1_i1:54-1991(+)
MAFLGPPVPACSSTAPPRAPPHAARRSIVGSDGTGGPVDVSSQLPSPYVGAPRLVTSRSRELLKTVTSSHESALAWTDYFDGDQIVGDGGDGRRIGSPSRVFPRQFSPPRLRLPSSGVGSSGAHSRPRTPSPVRPTAQPPTLVESPASAASLTLPTAMVPETPPRSSTLPGVVSAVSSSASTAALVRTTNRTSGRQGHRSTARGAPSDVTDDGCHGAIFHLNSCVSGNSSPEISMAGAVNCRLERLESEVADSSRQRKDLARALFQHSRHQAEIVGEACTNITDNREGINRLNARMAEVEKRLALIEAPRQNKRSNCACAEELPAIIERSTVARALVDNLRSRVDSLESNLGCMRFERGSWFHCGGGGGGVPNARGADGSVARDSSTFSAAAAALTEVTESRIREMAEEIVGDYVRSIRDELAGHVDQVTQQCLNAVRVIGDRQQKHLRSQLSKEMLADSQEFCGGDPMLWKGPLAGVVAAQPNGSEVSSVWREFPHLGCNDVHTNTTTCDASKTAGVGNQSYGSVTPSLLEIHTKKQPLLVVFEESESNFEQEQDAFTPAGVSATTASGDVVPKAGTIAITAQPAPSSPPPSPTWPRQTGAAAVATAVDVRLAACRGGGGGCSGADDRGLEGLDGLSWLATAPQ